MPLAYRIIGYTALSLLLIACEGPVGVMPGGALSGTVETPPAVWQLEKDADLAQLETRPADPYSINLVYVQLDGRLYIYAGNTRTNWVAHIEADPRMRIRINDTIYPMRAARVTDQDKIRQFAAVWASRSMFQRDPMQFDEVWLYRLAPRLEGASTP